MFSLARRTVCAGTQRSVMSVRQASVQLLSSSVSTRRMPAMVTHQRRQYHERVIDHYENPRNVGSFDKTAGNVGTGVVGAPACGDVMKVQIKVSPDGVITESVFKTFGCGSAIASSSLATEWIKGKTIDEALSIKNTDIATYLALPPIKLHCSMLAEDAIKSAIADYRDKQQQQQKQ